MLSQQEENKYISAIPSEIDGEDRRAAYSVISGFRDQKSKAQIASYYSLSVDLVEKWYKFFNFNETGTQKKSGRGSKKTNAVLNFVQQNPGRIVTPKEVVAELNVSLPTFYNFFNSNRQYFKKLKRGEFEIVNPEDTRNND